MSNNNKDEFLKINDTKVLYGLAILLMVFHHLFAFPERMTCTYVSILGGWGREYRLACFGKFCVAIYAFLSGFGLCKQFEKLQTTPSRCNSRVKSITINYRKCVNSLVGFYSIYWLIFIIFVPYRFIGLKYNFDFKEFLLNIFGISCTYNSEWWYVFTYIKILAILPIVDFISRWLIERYFNKIGRIVIEIVFLIFVCFMEQISGHDVLQSLQHVYSVLGEGYVMISIIGYMCAKQLFFDKMRKYISGVMVNLGILLFVIGARIYFANIALWRTYDWIFVVCFVFAFINIINKTKAKRITAVLCFFGKYSTYIWLCHSFFIFYYCPRFVFFPQYSVLIYAWVLALSLGSAICIKNLHDIMIKNDIIMRRR